MRLVPKLLTRFQTSIAPSSHIAINIAEQTVAPTPLATSRCGLFRGHYSLSYKCRNVVRGMLKSVIGAQGAELFFDLQEFEVGVLRSFFEDRVDSLTKDDNEIFPPIFNLQGPRQRPVVELGRSEVVGEWEGGAENDR